MGLHYSFNLYYSLDLLEKALLQLSRLNHCQEGKQTEIELPNGKCIALPFTSDFEEKSIKLLSNQESVNLDTVLIFPIDEPIREFMNSYYNALDRVDVANIGYIYLYISAGYKYTELSFMAATSSISRLFLESRSIRETFINFIRSTGGLFGHIDVEDDYYLSLTDPSQRIVIETSDIEVDFYPYYDVDLFVDRYLLQTANH